MKKTSLIKIFLAFLFLPVISLAEQILVEVNVYSVSAPSDLATTTVSTSSISFVWSAVPSSTSYRLFRNGTTVTTTATTSYTDTGLNPNTIYSYTVSSIDSDGIVSAQSSALLVTTEALPYVPPATPSSTASTPYPGGDSGGEMKSASEGIIVKITFNDTNDQLLGKKILLKLQAENASQIQISNTSDFYGLKWQEFSNELLWTLAKVSGKKTVYIRFRSFQKPVTNVYIDFKMQDSFDDFIKKFINLLNQPKRDESLSLPIKKTELLTPLAKEDKKPGTTKDLTSKETEKEKIVDDSISKEESAPQLKNQSINELIIKGFLIFVPIIILFIVIILRIIF